MLELDGEDAALLRVILALLTPAAGGWFDELTQAEARRRLLRIARHLEGAPSGRTDGEAE